MINTTASASRGKNNQTANAILIIIATPISPNDVSLLVFASWEKSSKEEYIVINGPTNHFDLSTIESSVSARGFFSNRVAQGTNQYSHSCEISAGNIHNRF